MPAGEDPRVGDRLARAREAIIDDRKLRDYALDPDHPDGGPKARLFAAILDIRREDWRHLRDELLGALPEGHVDRITASPYATTYGITLVVRGLNDREAQVTTAWQLHEGVPRLVTVYIDLASLGA